MKKEKSLGREKILPVFCFHSIYISLQRAAKAPLPYHIIVGREREGADGVSPRP